MSYSKDEICIRCGSKHLIKKGKGFSNMKCYWVQRYQCGDCNHKQTGKQRHYTLEEEFHYRSKMPVPMNWTAYTLAQKNNKQFLMQKLYEMLDEIEIKEKACMGRPQANLKGIVYALALKSYTRVSSRRLHSDLIEVQKAKQIESVPKYSTLMKYLGSEEVTTILEALIRSSNAPLEGIPINCASDSSGFSTTTFSPWYDARVGKEIDKRDFVKVHITIDVKTHIIVSVIVTPWNGADSPQFAPMVNETAKRFEVREFSADAAYSSRNNLEVVVANEAVPFIPFKSNVTGNNGGSQVWGERYRFFKNHKQEFGESYHKRSNVETVFSMIKRKFSQTLMSRNFQGQKNEILLKVLCHNITCLIHAHFEGLIQDPLWNQASIVEISLRKV